MLMYPFGLKEEMQSCAGFIAQNGSQQKGQGRLELLFLEVKGL